MWLLSLVFIFFGQEDGYGTERKAQKTVAGFKYKVINEKIQGVLVT